MYVSAYISDVITGQFLAYFCAQCLLFEIYTGILCLYRV